MWCLKNNLYLSMITISFLTCHGLDIDWKCESDVDCTASKSKCIENICKCESGYVFNSNMTVCLKIVSSYGALCQDTVQCSAFLFTGASCEIEKNTKNFTCVCGEGYHYLHGRCYRSSGLGEECRNNVDCYVYSDFEASSCKNGICVCSDDFYEREYRTCRRAAKAVDEECTVNIDCIFDKKATCPKFLCQLSEESNYLLHEFKNVDMKVETSSLENSCKEDKDCGNENMVCGPELKCTCKRSYFNFAGTCIPELGEPCVVDESPKTKIQQSVCRNGFWACQNGRVASLNNQKCLKVTRVYNGSCLSNEQCYVFGPDAICDEKKCVCNNNSHYEERELFCWINKGIGESCKIDQDCHIRNSEINLSCQNSICKCPDGTFPNSEQTSCVKIPTGINSTCEKSEDCVVNNGDCISKICACKQNYVPLTEDNCLKISSYGNKCEDDIQCNASLENSFCSPISPEKDVGKNSTSGICACANGYFYNNDKCFQKRDLGESCENQSECYLNNYIDRVKCRKGICSCDLKYKKLNATFCEKSGSSGINLQIWIGLVATIFNLLIL